MTGEVEVVAWRETLLSEIVSDPNLPPMAKVALEALRADNERLTAKVRELVALLDKAHGTPCEQIRHQQEVERLVKERDEIDREHLLWLSVLATKTTTEANDLIIRRFAASHPDLLAALARAERAEASLAGRDAEIAKAVAEERGRIVARIHALRPNYQSDTATDAGRRQMLDYFEEFVAPRARTQEPRS